MCRAHTKHVQNICSAYAEHMSKYRSQSMSDICQAYAENIKAICSILQAFFNLTYAEHILKKFVTCIKYRIAYAQYISCTYLVCDLHMHSTYRVLKI